jgi:hemolysin III
MAGAILAVAGLIVLLILARGRPWHTVGFAVYGASLVLLYTASAVYHSVHASEKGAEWLMRLDHIAIYLLIAGTYTPVCLTFLRGAWGWTLLGVEWGLAAIGIAIVLFWRRAPDWVRVVLYVCMGWLALAVLAPLREALPPSAIAWLVAGGVVYSIGCVIFALDRPHLVPGKFHAHDLWHVFVLGGSACHFVLVLRYLALG